jgi:GTP-binding protein HflX
MGTQRGNRGAMVRVALVGYTNVGKSTLMNAVGKSDVLSKTNFCNARHYSSKSSHQNLPFLLSDTVGFIRLPTQLVDSFKVRSMRFAKPICFYVVIFRTGIWRSYRLGKPNLIRHQGQWQTGNHGVFDAYQHLTIDEDDLMTEKTPRHYTLEEWKATWMSQWRKCIVYFGYARKFRSLENACTNP